MLKAKNIETIEVTDDEIVSHLLVGRLVHPWSGHGA